MTLQECATSTPRDNQRDWEESGRERSVDTTTGEEVEGSEGNQRQMDGTTLRQSLPNEVHLLPVLPVEAYEPHLPLVVSNNQGQPIDLPSVVIWPLSTWSYPIVPLSII